MPISIDVFVSLLIIILSAFVSSGSFCSLEKIIPNVCYFRLCCTSLFCCSVYLPSCFSFFFSVYLFPPFSLGFFSVVFIVFSLSVSQNRMNLKRKERASLFFLHKCLSAYITKLKMKMRNVSKRQQPDNRADNSRKPPMGLQCSDKLPHPKFDYHCLYLYNSTISTTSLHMV